jgi:hypothetical protein
MVTLAASLFSCLVLVVVAFQLALAAGLPWGEFSNGGRFPGKLPLAMRFAAIVQACVLGAIAVIVLDHASVLSVEILDRRMIWIVVLVAAVAFVLNLVTPSKKERLLWAPIAFLMLASSLMVAIGGRA